MLLQKHAIVKDIILTGNKSVVDFPYPQADCYNNSCCLTNAGWNLPQRITKTCLRQIHERVNLPPVWFCLSLALCNTLNHVIIVLNKNMIRIGLLIIKNL